MRATTRLIVACAIGSCGVDSLDAVGRPEPLAELGVFHSDDESADGQVRARRVGALPLERLELVQIHAGAPHQPVLHGHLSGAALDFLQPECGHLGVDGRDDGLVRRRVPGFCPAIQP